jgi:DNA polymerase-3 subunit alpha
MEIPLAEVEKVAKMIPPPVRGRNVSIDDAISQNPDFKSYIDSREQVAELIEIARRLEGCARHSSVHAAGVVISPVAISDLVPVCLGQEQGGDDAVRHVGPRKDRTSQDGLSRAHHADHH